MAVKPLPGQGLRGLWDTTELTMGGGGSSLELPLPRAGVEKCPHAPVAQSAVQQTLNL